MELPRNEIAFRKEYEKQVLMSALTTVFRPGNRVYPNWRGYKKGEVVTARIIEKCGSDELNIPPTFNDVRIKVQIAAITLHDISMLEPSDFAGSSPDVQDIPDLRAHLAHIYGKPIEHYGNEITKIQLAYIS